MEISGYNPLIQKDSRIPQFRGAREVPISFFFHHIYQTIYGRASVHFGKIMNLPNLAVHICSLIVTISSWANTNFIKRLCHLIMVLVAIFFFCTFCIFFTKILRRSIISLICRVHRMLTHSARACCLFWRPNTLVRAAVTCLRNKGYILQVGSR